MDSGHWYRRHSGGLLLASQQTGTVERARGFAKSQARFVAGIQRALDSFHVELSEPMLRLSEHWSIEVALASVP